MPIQALNDQQISIMCDIAGQATLKLTSEKRRELDALIRDGFVELTKSADVTNYKITASGQKVLDDHGVGVTES